MKRFMINEMECIPNRFKEHRLKAGLRQIDMAKKLGFTNAERISQWEKGKTFPHLINVLKLSAIYEVYPHELYAKLLDSLNEDIDS